MDRSNTKISGCSFCDGLMFEETQSKSQVEKIRDDIVLQKGSRKFPTQVKSSNGVVQEREILCIELEFLPLWLAKINITPRMQEYNPEVVEKLIDYQLHAKDVLAEYFLNKKKEKEEWNLTREVGKVDRKRMTASIDQNIPDSPNKKWCYPNYTNLVYEIIFNKDAKQMKAERGMKTNDALRDSFEKDELKLVDEAETIVTALIALGFTYEEIKIQLKNKFQNKLVGIV